MNTGDQAERVIQLFKHFEGILEGHFLLTSGLHSSMYVEKFRIFEHPDATAECCRMFAELFRGSQIATVVGPVTGGIILAHETAKQLGIRCVFAEREVKTDGTQGMTLRRGFQLHQDERVLVVEDILTTGRSIREVLEAVRVHRATVVGIGVMVDRSGGKIDFGVPLHALAQLEVPTYQSQDCPLCRQDIPLVKPGSRK